MTSCNHTTLELLPESKGRLRCRYCHLTLAGEELGDDGFCPECFDASGAKRYDFEEMATAQDAARYRCEDCGAVIKSW